MEQSEIIQLIIDAYHESPIYYHIMGTIFLLLLWALVRIQNQNRKPPMWRKKKQRALLKELQLNVTPSPYMDPAERYMILQKTNARKQKSSGTITTIALLIVLGPPLLYYAYLTATGKNDISWTTPQKPIFYNPSRYTQTQDDKFKDVKMDITSELTPDGKQLIVNTTYTNKSSMPVWNISRRYDLLNDKGEVLQSQEETPIIYIAPRQTETRTVTINLQVNPSEVKTLYHLIYYKNLL